MFTKGTTGPVTQKEFPQFEGQDLVLGIVPAVPGKPGIITVHGQLYQAKHPTAGLYEVIYFAWSDRVQEFFESLEDNLPFLDRVNLAMDEFGYLSYLGSEGEWAKSFRVFPNH